MFVATSASDDCVWSQAACLLFALLSIAIANAEGIVAPTPVSRYEWPADLDQFWQRSLAQLIPLEPGRLATQRGAISSPVTETATAPACWQPGRDPSATPIVHLVESSRPRPNRLPKDHRAHLFVSWRAYDRPLADWYLGGLRQPGDGGLMVSVLTACQTIALVRTWSPLTALRVGIVGDGYGGPMAMAAHAEGLFVPTRTVGDAHDDPVMYRDQPVTYP